MITGPAEDDDHTHPHVHHHSNDSSSGVGVSLPLGLSTHHEPQEPEDLPPLQALGGVGRGAVEAPKSAPHHKRDRSWSSATAPTGADSESIGAAVSGSGSGMPALALAGSGAGAGAMGSTPRRSVVFERSISLTPGPTAAPALGASPQPPPKPAFTALSLSRASAVTPLTASTLPAPLTFSTAPPVPGPTASAAPPISTAESDSRPHIHHARSASALAGSGSHPQLPVHAASLHMISTHGASLNLTPTHAAGAASAATGSAPTLSKPVSSSGGSALAGVLIVRVHRGDNLVSMDSNGLSDPYLVLSLATKTVKTKIIKKTLNPVWEEQFEFEITEPVVTHTHALLQPPPPPRPHVLHIKCWDWDFGTKDDPMGECDIPLHDFIHPPPSLPPASAPSIPGAAARRTAELAGERSYTLKNVAHGTIVITIIFKGMIR